MLVIRLSRTGRRNQPKYRVVVTEDSSKIQGKPVSVLGYYMPTSLDKKLVLDLEAVRAWIAKGAKPSNTVSKILNGQGFDLPVHQYQPSKAKKAPQEEAPKPAPAVEEASSESSVEQETGTESEVVSEAESSSETEPVVSEEATAEVAVEEEASSEPEVVEPVAEEASEPTVETESGDEPVA